jgi:hypothetical protein
VSGDFTMRQSSLGISCFSSSSDVRVYSGSVCKLHLYMALITCSTPSAPARFSPYLAPLAPRRPHVIPWRTTPPRASPGAPRIGQYEPQCASTSPNVPVLPSPLSASAPFTPSEYSMSPSITPSLPSCGLSQTPSLRLDEGFVSKYHLD